MTLYSIIHSPTKFRDHETLFAPTEMGEQEFRSFKNGLLADVLQISQESKDGKTLYCVQNTDRYFAFGVNVNITKATDTEMIDEKYAIRRRGEQVSDVTAFIGAIAIKDGNSLAKGISSGLSSDITTIRGLLQMYQVLVSHHWEMPRGGVFDKKAYKFSLNPSKSDYVDVPELEKALKAVAKNKRAFLTAKKKAAAALEPEIIYQNLITLSLTDENAPQFTFLSGITGEYMKLNKNITIGMC